jgi:transposase
MPKSHRPYSAEFRQRITILVRQVRVLEELAQQFEPSAQAIRNWVRPAARDAGQRQDGLTTKEREELRRLRRENRMHSAPSNNRPTLLPHAPDATTAHWLGRSHLTKHENNPIRDKITDQAIPVLGWR